MKTKKTNKHFWGIALSLALSLGLVSACQTAGPTAAPTSVLTNQPLANTAVATTSQPQINKLDLQAQAQVTSSNQGKAQIQVQVQFSNTDFKTQAFNCSDIGFIKASISGLGISNEILANGSDVNDGLIANGGGCSINASFSAVPVGLNRYVQIEAYTASKTLISGLQIAGLMTVGSNTNPPIEISYRTLVTAQIIKALQDHHGAKGKAMVSRLDAATLQSFVDSVTGAVETQSVPRLFSYVNHPARINAALIAADIIAADGLATLNSANAAYLTTTGTVVGVINNTALGDQIQILIQDPLSNRIPIVATGSPDSFTVPNVPAGTWLMKVINTTTGNDVQKLIQVNAGQTLSGLTVDFNQPLFASWFQTNIPSGGLVYSIKQVPLDANAYYAGTSRGVYKTTDSGLNWSFSSLHQHKITSLLVLGDGTVAVAGTPNGIFKTSDGGSNWTQTLAGVEVFKLIVDPNNATHILAAVRGGIRESSDSGDIWSSSYSAIVGGGTFTGNEISDLVYAGLDLFITVPTGSQAGIYKSNNFALGFNPFNTGFTLADGARTLKLVGSKDLYVGTDSGKVYKADALIGTWDDMSVAAPAPVRALGFNNLNGDFFAGTKGAAVQKSLISTTWSWSDFLSGPPPINNPFVLSLETNGAGFGNDNIMVGTEGGGVMRSGSTQWDTRNNGLNAAEITDIVTYQNGGQTYKFIATKGGGVFRFDPTASPSVAWQPLLNVPAQAGRERYVTALAIEAHDLTPTLYASFDGGIRAFPNALAANHTDTWVNFESGLSANPTISDLVVVGGQLFASATGDGGSTSKGIYRSSCLLDAGCSNGSWAKMSPIGSFSSLAAHPSNTTKLYAGQSDGSVNYSLDAGVNWLSYPTAFSHPVVSLATAAWSGHEDDLFAVAQDPNGSPQIQRLDSASGQWQNLALNLPPKATQAVVADPTNSGLLFVGLKNGGVYRTTEALTVTPGWSGFSQTSGSVPSLSDLSATSLSLNNMNNTLYTGTDGLGLYQTNLCGAC